MVDCPNLFDFLTPKQHRNKTSMLNQLFSYCKSSSSVFPGTLCVCLLLAVADF
eukprot:m.270338 g.270338  ORF g.270338 m.270338 type:complete len:53 (+) comp46705_c0_seq1:24-182(+)